MKVKNPFRILAALLLLFSGNSFIYAHDGGHPEEKKNIPASAEKYFSSEAISDKYELLLRYNPILPGEKTQMTLFVSEFSSNKPVDNAEIKISAQEDAGIKFKIQKQDKGTYTVEGTFPAKKIYSLSVNINSSYGADLILIQNIEIGKELPHEDEIANAGFISLKVVLLGVLILFVGILLGTLIQKRNSGKVKSTASIFFLLLMISIPVTPSIAHGDEDHNLKKQSSNFSNNFLVPKETQFLFEIFTEKTTKDNFTQSTNLFGTILPGSQGQEIISSAQNGKVISVNVKVGQKVKKGQSIAEIEQNIDAGTQVNMLAEKNNLTSEFEAAKKDWERLSSIKDIAAKKDLDEALSRLQKAETNLKLFNSNSGKIISLKSPINGTVGTFTLSIGSTINAGQPLFTITDLSVVYVEAQVFDTDANKVKEGAKFTVECSNDNHKTSEVQLLSLAQEINATNQSQKVLFELRNPDSDFKIGEFVNIRVFSSVQTMQIALPNSSITEINGKPVVFIKDAAESYSVSYVQLGENNGSHTTILNGVEEGERAVINGSYQMKMIFLNQE